MLHIKVIVSLDLGLYEVLTLSHLPAVETIPAATCILDTFLSHVKHIYPSGRMLPQTCCKYVSLSFPWTKGKDWYSSVFVCLCQVDEEPDPISLGVCGVGQPPQGLKRKAETPLGSPPEPGQVLQQQDDDGRGARFKIRVTVSLISLILVWF